jgi:hypothetical protein
MKTLLDAVIEIATENYDGHVSLLTFTTGWKVIFGTPDDLGYPGKQRDQLHGIPGFMSLDDALLYAIAYKPEWVENE